MQDRPSAIFTYETAVPDYIRRLACNLSGVHGDYIFRPDIHPPPDWMIIKFCEAMKKIKASPMRIIKANGMNAYDIAHRCRLLKPQFVAVDYLGLMPRLPDVSPKEGKEREVASNSAALFGISSELDSTLMVIQHTAGGDRSGEAAWSAAPENDATLTLSIEEDAILIKSQRNGESGGRMPIKFHGATYSFRETDSVPEKLPVPRGRTHHKSSSLPD